MLEVEVMNMEDINDVETDIDHQDTWITLMEETIIDNGNDISGRVITS